MVESKHQKSRDPLIGTMIDGYIIEDILGRGGMARVYRGYDVNLERYVAIKVIDPHTRDKDEYNRRFRREALSIARLKHPNIVTVYRFGEVDDLYYMAMDYIDGPDLARVIADYRDDDELMPLDDVLRIITQVGMALDYAHKNGIIHRDIKPSNIMLNPDSQAILTDFGLALMTSEGTTGDVFGSPYYIAPEQVMSSATVVPQSDLYSLGITLYEMLTGSVPFKGDQVKIIMAHMSDEPPPPQDFNSRLHKAFNPVLEKALAKEPSQRYSSGAKLAAALKNAIRTAERDHNATSRLRRVRTDEPEADSNLRLSTVELPDRVRKYRVEHALPPKAITNFPEVQRVSPATDPLSSTTPVQTQAPSRRRRSPLLLLIALLLILGAGAGVFVATQTDLLAQLTGAQQVTISVEGIVRAVDAQSITIYDQRFLIDTSNLPSVTAGDRVLLEGIHQREGDALRVRQPTLTVLDP